MRPLWRGAISFGLVNIPVSLYPATKAKEKIDFDMLRDTDHSRIHYKRVAEADGKEVPWEHIVKGYEYEKGKYVVVTPEDFQRVQIRSNQVVDIKEFVEVKEIDPRFYDEPYYLAPEKGGAKAYTLLRDALQESGKAGVAKVVIRPPREHLAIVEPLDSVLLLELLHFPEELRAPAELKIPDQPVGRKELDMALSLINNLAGRWEPEKYHDEYHDALLRMIEQKIKAGGRKLPAPKEAPQKAPGKVIDLVSVLQQSLAEAGKAQPRPGRGRSRPSTARRKAA